MRALIRHALVATAVCSVGLSIWACDAKKQTEYVAGVSTQVQVPRDLKTVRVDINVGGVNVFCKTYKVYDGRVQLPRSLGSFPASGSPTGDPVTVTVVGFTEDAEDVSKQDIYSCLQKVNTSGDSAVANARILRRSRQPYVKDEILFLPMALKFACFQKNCETDAQSMTCKAGRCVDAVTDERTLPVYSDDLVDGTGGGCFHASQCFQGALPAATVNADDCTFAIPNTTSSPPLAVDAGPIPTIEQQGLNVQIVWDGGYTQEILDKSPDEGFTVPDPNKPQQFKLAPGLCDFVKGFDSQDPTNPPTAHRITGIFASPICQPKGPFQPLCAGDMLAAMGVDTNGVGPTPDKVCNATEVKPPKSLLMIVADDTANSEIFFKDAADLTVKLSISDPAFDSTQIGLIYTPQANICTETDLNKVQAVPLTLAKNAKPLVAASFAAKKVGPLETRDSDVNLDGALKSAYTALASAPDADNTIYRRAVLVTGNRELNTSFCGGASTPAQLAAAALTSPTPTKTFVALLARDTTDGHPDPLPDAIALAVAGSSTDPAKQIGPFDARGGNQAAASNAFRAIVEDLATCVYDVPTTQVADSKFLAYQDPLNPLPAGKKSIAFDAGCNEANADNAAVSGWGRGQVIGGKTRLFLCGDACGGYRTVRQNAANQAALYLQTPPGVPMFYYDAGCAPKTTP